MTISAFPLGWVKVVLFSNSRDEFPKAKVIFQYKVGQVDISLSTVHVVQEPLNISILFVKGLLNSYLFKI